VMSAVGSRGSVMKEETRLQSQTVVLPLLVIFQKSK
jgi:hypothetical protein